jgi:hypothetical protein
MEFSVEELRKQTNLFLSNADLNHVSLKGVRIHLEELFRIDLSDYKVIFSIN